MGFVGDIARCDGCPFELHECRSAPVDTTVASTPVPSTDGTNPNPSSVVSSGGEASFITSSTIEDLVARSTIVAIGTVVGPGIQKTIQGRDPNDPSKADPGFAESGTVSTIQVERVLKGTALPVLQVIQFEKVIMTVNGKQFIGQRSDARFPINQGQRYLLFLRPQGQAPDMPNLMLGTARPFRFVLVDGKATVESPWDEAASLFPVTTESTLVTRIETAVANGG